MMASHGVDSLPLRVLIWSPLSLSLLVAGCAATPMTLAKELAWERWKKCEYTERAELMSITPDGEIWFRASSTRAVEAVQECLRRASAEQAIHTAIVRAPEPAGTTSPQSPEQQRSLTESPLDAPVWERAYEWAYRWESPRGKGTFVWVMNREEVVDGTQFYVVTSGRREIYWRKADLAWHMDKVEGTVEERTIPPFKRYVWPLAPGKTWEQIFTRERPGDRTTEEVMKACRVEGEESITVPAGTFWTLKIICRNQRTDAVTDEIWYSPEVKNWIRERSRLSYGIRERELIAFRLR